MHTLDEMVMLVEGWFYRGSATDQQAFLNTPREKLAMYHSSLGRNIRNEFKLRETEWKPEIIDGVDHSPDHPDQISMRVMEKVWDKLHNQCDIDH